MAFFSSNFCFGPVKWNRAKQQLVLGHLACQGIIILALELAITHSDARHTLQRRYVGRISKEEAKQKREKKMERNYGKINILIVCLYKALSLERRLPSTGQSLVLLPFIFSFATKCRVRYVRHWEVIILFLSFDSPKNNDKAKAAVSAMSMPRRMTNDDDVGGGGKWIEPADVNNIDAKTRSRGIGNLIILFCSDGKWLSMLFTLRRRHHHRPLSAIVLHTALCRWQTIVIKY